MSSCVDQMTSEQWAKKPYAHAQTNARNGGKMGIITWRSTSGRVARQLYFNDDSRDFGAEVASMLSIVRLSDSWPL